jgi:hypothetical protein
MSLPPLKYKLVAGHRRYDGHIAKVKRPNLSEPVVSKERFQIDLRVAEKMFCPERRRMWPRIQGAESGAYRNIRCFPQHRRRGRRQAGLDKTFFPRPLTLDLQTRAYKARVVELISNFRFTLKAHGKTKSHCARICVYVSDESLMCVVFDPVSGLSGFDRFA